MGAVLSLMDAPEARIGPSEPFVSEGLGPLPPQDTSTDGGSREAGPATAGFCLEQWAIGRAGVAPLD